MTVALIIAAAGAAASEPDAWQWLTRGGSSLGALAFVISIALGLRALGVFNRPKHRITAGFQRPGAISVLPSTPRFVVKLENRGNVPVTFQDFELLLPRLGEDALRSEGGFRRVGNGARLYVDGVEQGWIEAAQAFEKIDRLTKKIRLEPHTFETEIFDLTALEEHRAQRFEPILTFYNSFGEAFWCTHDGVVNAGHYVYPHQDELDAAFRAGKLKRLTSRRRAVLRWRGWKHTDDEYEPDPAHRGRS